MTLAQLRDDLKQHKIRQVGILKKSQNGRDCVTIYFSADEKIVFPFRPKSLYPLVLSSEKDETHVHSEKVKALKRSLIPNWDEE